MRPWQSSDGTLSLLVIVMAEGNETPGGDPGGGLEGRGHRTEGDLLAERRARRAAETGEVALTRRAEAAEATVQTLERHVASLQQRLQEAEDELQRMAELLEVEQASTLDREHELRSVKQREYAEQQLRVEAEERLLSLDREGRAEIERLDARLRAGELEAGELAARLERMQRSLAELEQSAAAERAVLRRTEQELWGRLGELEQRVSQVQGDLDAERIARERSEQLLQRMRAGQQQMEGIVGEMKGVVSRLIAAVAGAGAPAAPRPPAPQGAQPATVKTHAGGQTWAAPAVSRVEPPTQLRGVEMADALAAAVERLRARAEAVPPSAEVAPAPRVQQKPHKHSMSLVKRWRIRRKQRRGR